METDILDIIENGLFISDAELNIIFWNRWLAIQTGVPKGEALGKRLDQLFPETSFSILKRKIRIALRLNSSTFMNSSVERYVIPIKLTRITKSIFRHMRQDVVITPLNDTDVGIIIYDVSPLLEAQSIIDEQLKLLERRAKIDGLTQCYNKYMFNEILSVEIKKAKRYGHTFSLILFDIDNFKIVNDTYGHLEGDHVLKELAAICAKGIRESDIMARWGGEEFCVLLPGAGIRRAATLGDRLREIIEAHDFGTSGHQHCSFGISQYNAGTDANLLVENADKALYHAKENGKNQVAVFDQNQTTTWFSSRKN